MVHALIHFTRIIHPTDLSDEGDLAFAHGLKLALAARGRFSLVHTAASAVVGNEWSAFPKVRDRLTLWRILPDGAAEESVGELGLTVSKADLDSTHPAQAIAAYVERQGCDLIVLATHARNGVERWLSRTVAEPLSREARTSTLFLPEGAIGFVDAGTGAARLRNILIPVDSSPDPARAIDSALELVRLLDAPAAVIHLLHIGPSAPEVPAQLAGRPGVRQITREAADVVDAICETAEDGEADLIVMATRGHDGFLDALRGSTTERVLRQANRALLAVPET